MEIFNRFEMEKIKTKETWCSYHNAYSTHCPPFCTHDWQTTHVLTLAIQTMLPHNSLHLSKMLHTPSISSYATIWSFHHVVDHVDSKYNLNHIFPTSTFPQSTHQNNSHAFSVNHSSTFTTTHPPFAMTHFTLFEWQINQVKSYHTTHTCTK